ncbi:MAG: UDP-2,3-diacylglucosamine diphosphatase [Gammaproteobacteria bacterium]
MTTWFVSDVHLDQTRPDIAAAFGDFLTDTVAGADAIYVLGDLFESWIGDDDPDPTKHVAMGQLRALREAGTRCYFSHGNRDFLAGERFSRESGCELLDEEHVITLGDERVLLMHGDSLCIDDHQYMAFRSQVRNPAWQAGVMALSIPERQALAAQARNQSATDMAQKAEDIMDVNAGAVADAMGRHNVQTLIHGHTHRPADHRIDIDGLEHVRHVLGDWYEQGRVLRYGAGELTSVVLDVAGRCES